MQGFELDFEPNSIICREGDVSTDLYFVQSGKLLVCTINGTEVKALSRIHAGEFMGELSFFDGKARSGHVVALEKSRLIQIPQREISKFLPQWYSQIGKNLTKKIRLLDHMIHDNKIRSSGSSESKPLTIEEQRALFDLLTN